MFNFFIKLKNYEYTEFDDPISFALYTSEDLSTKTPFGLKYIECTDTVKREELKKVTISKLSIIVFIILIICSLTLILL